MQQPDTNVRAKLSIEYHALTQMMIQTAEYQQADIKAGKLSIGFGDFYGTNKTLRHFKVCYEDVLINRSIKINFSYLFFESEEYCV